jgi:hypothetical protein
MWQGTDMEVLRQLALDQPPRLEDLAVDAPKELCALYMRLVARDPKSRPPTAHDVAEELRAFVSGRTGTKDMKALMITLFADDAARRKDELSRALEGVAPAEASALRESLVPDESVAVATQVVPARAEPAGKRGVVMLVALAVAAASIALGTSLKNPAAVAPPSPSMALAAPPEPPPPPTPATSTPAVTATPAPSTTIKIARPPLLPAAPKPKASSSSKPVDVDPDPI